MLYAIPLTAFTIKLVDLITNKRIMDTILNLTNDETEEEEEKKNRKRYSIDPWIVPYCFYIQYMYLV